MNMTTKCCLANSGEMRPYLPKDLGWREGFGHSPANRLDVGQDPELPNWCPVLTFVLLSILLWQQSQDPNLFLVGGEECQKPPSYHRALAHAVAHCSPQSIYTQSSPSQFWVLQGDTLWDHLRFQRCNTVRWESNFFLVSKNRSWWKLKNNVGPSELKQIANFRFKILGLELIKPSNPAYWIWHWKPSRVRTLSPT